MIILNMVGSTIVHIFIPSIVRLHENYSKIFESRVEAGQVIGKNIS